MTSSRRGRLAFAVQVVAGLQDRPQRGVAQRGGRDPGHQAGRPRWARSATICDQFAVDRVEVARAGSAADRAAARRGPHRPATSRRPGWPGAAVPAAARLPVRAARSSRCSRRLERFDRHPEPCEPGVSSDLGQLDVRPEPMVRPGPREDPQHPLGRLPRALDRVEVEPDRRPARGAKASGSTARSTSSRNALGPFVQEEVAGVEVRGQGQHPHVQLVAQEELQGPVGRRSGRPRRRRRPGTTRSASRRRRRTWSSPRAVPRVPTTLPSPTWCAAITSV